MSPRQSSNRTYSLSQTEIKTQNLSIVVEETNTEQGKGNIEFDTEWDFFVFLENWEKISEITRRVCCSLVLNSLIASSQSPI